MLLTEVLLRIELCVKNEFFGRLGRGNDGELGEAEGDNLDKSDSCRCLGLVPAGDIARSPVSSSLSFSFARSGLMINPFFSSPLKPFLPNRLRGRPNDPNTEV